MEVSATSAQKNSKLTAKNPSFSSLIRDRYCKSSRAPIGSNQWSTMGYDRRRMRQPGRSSASMPNLPGTFWPPRTSKNSSGEALIMITVQVLLSCTHMFHQVSIDIPWSVIINVFQRFAWLLMKFISVNNAVHSVGMKSMMSLKRSLADYTTNATVLSSNISLFLNLWINFRIQAIWRGYCVRKVHRLPTRVSNIDWSDFLHSLVSSENHRACGSFVYERFTAYE